MQILEATIADASTIVDFQIAMALETEQLVLHHNTITSGVAHIFQTPADGLYLVVKISNNTVASCMITYEWSDWRSTRVWWLQSVYVIPEYRKQGVFTAICMQVKSMAKAQGCSLLRLYVEQHNAAAAATYIKNGFTKTHYHLFECSI